MEYITFIFQFIFYLCVFVYKEITASSCQRQKMDIIFMLDSSYSMHKHQFGQELQFVANVIDHFDISKAELQVGVITFNHELRVEIRLDSFQDKIKLKEAIVNIPYVGGGTDIGEAIRYGRTEMFSKQYGGRKEAKKLMVVITDGQSDNQTKTDSESRLAKLSGIHIIAVGVGNLPNDKELKLIASDPKEESVFKVDDFDSLDTIVGSLSAQTCSDDTHIQNDEVSSPKECRPVDLFFVIDNSNSIWLENFKKVLTFISNLVASFEMSPIKTTRFGVISYSDDVKLMLPIDNKMNRTEITNAVLNFTQLTGGTDTGKAIRYLSSDGFSESQERPGAARVAIIFTDGKSKHPEETKMAAYYTKKQGIYLISVGIEEQSDLQELNEIASEPKDKFTFNVKDYNTLGTIKERLITSTCQVLADQAIITDKTMCKFSTSTDMTFIYDASAVGLYRSKIIRKSIASLVKEIDFRENNVKVGVLSKTCSKQKDVFLSDYKLKSEFITLLRSKASDGVTQLLRKYRIKSQKERQEGKTHKSIVVLFIDENLTFPETAAKEAKRTSFHSKVYVMSVGDAISKHQAEDLCSSPANQYLYHIKDYNELPYSLLKLFQDICS